MIHMRRRGYLLELAVWFRCVDKIFSLSSHQRKEEILKLYTWAYEKLIDLEPQLTRSRGACDRYVSDVTV
jgi:hypothetical protein